MTDKQPRSVEEIVARIKEREKADFFGFEVGDLICALSFEDAKPWLKDTATGEDWTNETATPECALAAAKEYMDFAWEKANNCRGLSAARSISHMRAWLWLAREDALLSVIEDDSAYRYYGKPQLRAICDHFGWDWRSLDDGEWGNDESGPKMSADEIPAMSVSH